MRREGWGRRVLSAGVVLAAVLPVSGAAAGSWQAPVTFDPSAATGSVSAAPRPAGTQTIRVRVPFAAFARGDGLPRRLQWGHRYRTDIKVFVASNAAAPTALVRASGARVLGCSSLRLFAGGVNTLRCHIEVGRLDRRGVRRLPGLVRLDATVHTGRSVYRARYTHSVDPRPACRRRGPC